MSLITLNAVWQHRWLVLAVTGSSMLLGVGYLTVAEPVYEAQVRVLIQNRGLNLDGRGLKAPDKEFLSTQCELIRSPLIVQDALETAAGATAAPTAADPVDDVIERLRVIPLANTDIVRVSYQAVQPQLAVDRLRSLIAAYRRHVHELEQRAANESLHVLSQRVADLRQQLQQRHAELAAARAESPLVGDAQEAVQSEQSTLKELADRLTLARSRRIQLEQLTAWHAAQDSSGNAPAIADSVFDRELAAARREWLAAQAEADGLTRIYKPDHPERQAAHQRVAALAVAYQQLRTDAVKSLRSHLSAAQAEESSLETTLTGERQRLKSLDEALLRERQLLAEIDRLKAMHTAASTSLEALHLSDRALAEGRASISIHVLDSFQVPEQPIWPQPLPLLVVSGALGLALSLGLVVLHSAGAATPPPVGMKCLLASTGPQPASDATEQLAADVHSLSDLVAGSEPIDRSAAYAPRRADL